MDVKKLAILCCVTQLFVACGTVPVPVKKASPQEPAITRISDSNKTGKSNTDYESDMTDSGSTKSNGSSNQATSEDDDKISGPKPVTTLPPVEKNTKKHIPERTVKEHVNTAIEYLQEGEEAKAKIELESAIRQEPDNMTAINLLVQINSTPEKFFKEKKSFSYKVESGESLSMIARKFLDDPLQFHILAKYNDIENPNDLQAGQIIRVPGERKEPVAPKKKATPIADDEVGLKLALAQRLYDSGKFQETIDLLENIETKGKYVSKQRDLLVLTYAQYANVLTEKAELLEAEAILEKAVSMEPGNKKLKDQLSSLKNRRKANDFYNEGLQAMTDGDQDKAFEAFQKVVKLNPSHELAKRKIAEIKSEVIESLHKTAMQAYRKQELDKAIELWDKVLELEPEHELAKLYRARAIGLKKRFDNL